jgi:hypothetical protein
MSPLTLFLAKLIGSALLIFGVAMGSRKAAIVATAKRAIHDPGMALLSGVLPLIGGLAIVLGHDIWVGGALPVAVTPRRVL